MTDVPQDNAELAAAAEDELMLPGFVCRRDEAMYVDLAALGADDSFRKWVERVFSSGMLFRDLDYATFHKLLYADEAEAIDQTRRQLEQAGKRAELHLAKDIERFPENRRPLYRGFKIDDAGKVAEYFFEPLIIDVVVDEPIHGAADADGNRAVTGTRQRELAQATQLNFDEFVAAAWEKGLRFGLDAAAIRAGIQKTKPERVTIARMLAPSPGSDASVVEKTDALYRNDSPKILPNGRIDLRHFSNRFPQVKAGTPLMMKVRRVFGQGRPRRGRPDHRTGLARGFRHHLARRPRHPHRQQ
ncbi:MAG: hypothetical protein HXY26_06300 [Hydrogenophilaceae bacterium]|nr:hypothetical protein [Hydrogenophilaceae bacterium]